MNEYYFKGKFNYLYKETERPDYSETALHSHSMYEILYFQSGDGELVLADRKTGLESGALIFIPPGTAHCIILSTGRTYRRSVINFESPPDVARELFEKVTVFSHTDSRINSVFARMKDYSGLFEGEQKDLIIKNLVTELILLLSKTAAPSARNYGKVITDAISFINKNLSEIKSINSLCEYLHISRAGLYREFYRELGISPMKYVNIKRLETAQNLIRIGENPTKVCFRVGFGDYSAFYKAYKARFGCSPANTKLY